MPRCIGITKKSGTQCKNQAKDGCEYCVIHSYDPAAATPSVMEEETEPRSSSWNPSVTTKTTQVPVSESNKSERHKVKAKRAKASEPSSEEEEEVSVPKAKSDADKFGTMTKLKNENMNLAKINGELLSALRKLNLSNVNDKGETQIKRITLAQLKVSAKWDFYRVNKDDKTILSEAAKNINVDRYGTIPYTSVKAETDRVYDGLPEDVREKWVRKAVDKAISMGYTIYEPKKK